MTSRYAQLVIPSVIVLLIVVELCRSSSKLTGGARNLVSSEADISGTVTLGSSVSLVHICMLLALIVC